MKLWYFGYTRAALGCLLMLVGVVLQAQETRTVKPPLHARQWMAITGKPLGATAGAMMFQKGGNAIDAACAMIAATSTMWDVLSWGGETQALVFNPKTGKVVAINALGVAPTGATPELFRSRGMSYPPEYGALAAITPGTPGGILTLLAEFGTLSLAEVLGPSIELADGYPIERETADSIEEEKERLKQWPDSKRVMLVHAGEAREAPRPGELFRQPDLAATLRKLVKAEQAALDAGKDRKAAIQAAYDRFYKGDIAQEFVRGARELGGLITAEDLARWQVHIEAPRTTSYKGIDVYKLDTWVQGPVMLQTLNILETFDLKSMGYNTTRYLHTLYQAMNLAYADRDFYYGDPYFPPEEPVQGLLSKEYARERAKLIRFDRNDPDVRPGDPYPFQGSENPYLKYLEQWRTKPASSPKADAGRLGSSAATTASAKFERAFFIGTTSVVAADAEGWVASVTPSGGWIPAVIAGRTGIGMSQRAQAFVLDPAENPFNVIEPGKRPRATLTPSLALKDGKPFLAFAIQGGDAQDQNLLQFFLNIVEFGMTPQKAAEAENILSFQMRESFGEHSSDPGSMIINESMPHAQQQELRKMGYTLKPRPITSGPVNAILFDREHGTMWGASSHHGEDYGIAW